MAAAVGNQEDEGDRDADDPQQGGTHGCSPSARSPCIMSKRRAGFRALRGQDMLYLFIKAALSGILIAIISEVAKRYPGFGGLIASLPLVSVLGMIWLWRDKPDAANMAAHAEGTFWFVLPSLPMFLVIPAMLRSGFSFWLSLAAGCALTIFLYSMMIWAG